MAQSKLGFDSLGRKWRVTIENGFIELQPIGHDTDPDGPGLSMEDELALFALAPETPSDSGFDPGLLYDQARDRAEEMMAGCA